MATEVQRDEAERLARELGGGWNVAHGVMPVIILTLPEARRLRARQVAAEGDAIVIHLEPDADAELVDSQLREALDGTGIRSVLVSADVATSVAVARGRG